jgi:hypothetical protein
VRRTTGRKTSALIVVGGRKCIVAEKPVARLDGVHSDSHLSSGASEGNAVAYGARKVKQLLGKQNGFEKAGQARLAEREGRRRPRQPRTYVAALKSRSS